jgi:hypothetical protein
VLSILDWLLWFTLARLFLFLLRAGRLTTIGNIETTPPENDRDGMNDTVGLPLALGTESYRFLSKVLPSFKAMAAKTTLVFIGRH